MFTFEKLDAWQQAINFTNVVYDQTRSFRPDERFGPTNQMRRAAVSVSSNLAEGSSRSSRVDFAWFVEISAGSLFEVISQAFVAKRQESYRLLNSKKLYAIAERKGKIQSGLRNSLLTG
jgi:four helix bundle protein